ncbi:NAD(P)-dependent dehydrogenase (short-subunit alcohol dehydrogenase family) [Dysgonomonas sp. PH5-45]|uniref:SDR family NAD(P)-dependent oxidoreductase n=1 Tax=unclassified Dysgonomonas TaxID=2630389 RepID=UPI00247575C1|nr:MULTISPECIES: glucose 1-dehydrogenase [unclassified Dysgonomonas]MDH6354005.1 NAD(P)-dependent dehydrogenase (short-subunit alcohol dehydrogenase family) [Dysgonomonas sp. PH5-45]MDH6386907.1 NAD(P)-dependent dehydrogenase (short-subunit alcohol dehydrogenase family) [Dysgonomonas sp. PH5-37]
MSLFSLKGRVAVVTGASSGLGKRFAEVLAKQGADIAIVARRLDRLEEHAKTIEALGVKCLPVKCDATNEEEVVAAVKKIVAHFGKIDILVNNAGIAIGGETENVPGKDFRSVVDVNLNGVFYFAREAGKDMIKNQYGRIINVASMYGQVGNKFTPCLSYHASKGAVINLSRGLAAEWAKHKITVNSLCPGFFDSEMTDAFIETNEFSEFVKNTCCLERTGKPQELDTALIFLAADGSSYITGQPIFVDGGWTAI